MSETKLDEVQILLAFLAILSAVFAILYALAMMSSWYFGDSTWYIAKVLVILA